VIKKAINIIILHKNNGNPYKPIEINCGDWELGIRNWDCLKI
jgi:hypothetical protein